jgi:hypothetical protein
LSTKTVIKRGSGYGKEQAVVFRVTNTLATRKAYGFCITLETVSCSREILKGMEINKSAQYRTFKRCHFSCVNIRRAKRRRNFVIAS